MSNPKVGPFERLMNHAIFFVNKSPLFLFSVIDAHPCYHAKLVLTHISAINNIVGYCCDVFTIYLSNASLKRERMFTRYFQEGEINGSSNYRLLSTVFLLPSSQINTGTEKDYTVASIVLERQSNIIWSFRNYTNINPKHFFKVRSPTDFLQLRSIS